MYEHTLIPTDGSELSHRAVVAGVKLARALGARVTGLFAAPAATPLVYRDLLPVGYATPQKHAAMIRQAAQRHLAVIERAASAARARSEYNSIFAIGVSSNWWMVWAVTASFLLVLMVVYVPFLNPFFDTVPLTLDDWLFMLPFFFASPIAMELVKLYFRRRTATLATAAA